MKTLLAITTWLMFTVAAGLAAYRVYWMNLHYVGARSGGPLAAIPLGLGTLGFFAFIIAVLTVERTQTQKFLMGLGTLLLVLLALYVSWGG